MQGCQSPNPQSFSSKIMQRQKITTSLKTQKWCWLFLYDIGIQLLELCILLGPGVEENESFWFSAQNCSVNSSMPISTSGSLRRKYGGAQSPLWSFPHMSDSSHRNQACPELYCFFISKPFVLIKCTNIYMYKVPHNTNNMLPEMCAFSPLSLLQFKTGFFPLISL